MLRIYLEDYTSFPIIIPPLGGEGGGEGDCSIGVDEADEQCKGAPANHRDKHRQKKKIMKIGFEAHGEGECAK